MSENSDATKKAPIKKGPEEPGETGATKEPQDKVVEAEVVTKVKMVSIQALEDHNCNIAGQAYSFEKDQKYQVPEDVAFILSGSRKAVKN